MISKNKNIGILALDISIGGQGKPCLLGKRRVKLFFHPVGFQVQLLPEVAAVLVDGGGF